MHFKLLILLLLPLSLMAQPGYFEPWGKDADLYQRQQGASPADRSLLVQGAEQVIRFHQNVISPVDGPRSHFRPSSSAYMMQAMQKHGFWKGFILGCDRLMRENGDKWCYRTIEENGKLYKYDPVP